MWGAQRNNEMILLSMTRQWSRHTSCLTTVEFVPAKEGFEGGQWSSFIDVDLPRWNTARSTMSSKMVHLGWRKESKKPKESSRAADIGRGGERAVTGENKTY